MQSVLQIHTFPELRLAGLPSVLILSLLHIHLHSLCLITSPTRLNQSWGLGKLSQKEDFPNVTKAIPNFLDFIFSLVATKSFASEA